MGNNYSTRRFSLSYLRCRYTSSQQLDEVPCLDDGVGVPGLAGSLDRHGSLHLSIKGREHEGETGSRDSDVRATKA